MNFKLDENFGTRTQRIFRELGHNADSVIDEGLGGASDIALYQVCREHGLCLVTLDLDFSDVLRFPPQGTGASSSFVARAIRALACWKIWFANSCP